MTEEPSRGDSSEGVPRISVVVPVFNEQRNIAPLLAALGEALADIPGGFEIVAVNDGSRDGSLAALIEGAKAHPQLRIVDFRRNFGQTAALMAGIDHAVGEIVVLIDADLQNDPRDIPMLVEKLGEGFDVVSGWRRDRKDARLSRNFPSQVANGMISWISGVRLHDYGCTLKAYRADVLKGVRLYGEMHRFIPIYAHWMGGQVTELPVRHHARQFGRSNYGLERILKVLLDLVVVKFLDRYLVKPIYIFGGFAALSLMGSVAALAVMIGLKVFAGVSMISTPLPLLTAMMFLVGVLSLLMGLLAEITVRTYFEAQNRRHYLVRKLYNFPDGP
ncbi:MAG: glycosyltransferase family 2 protein [Alphaproteobacteria bacterium]|nr:glycosyltransferase family 2 protein [Alphaproteobacteria bacterium]